MSAWKSARITANGIRIAYTRTGGDKPPLVLAHGITDSGLCWGRVARALEDAYDVIMVDARGHGETEAPRGGYNWDTLREDLAAFIRALGLERPYLMGHSMGAETIAQVAGHYPELAGRIVLEDPPWREGGFNRVQRLVARRKFREAILERRVMAREDLLAQCRSDSPTWAEGEYEPWADSKLQVSPHVANITSSARAPWRKTAERLTVPTLLITGEPGKAIVTREVAAEALGLMAHGEELHLPGAGHSIHRERFTEVIEAVRAFLQGD